MSFPDRQNSVKSLPKVWPEWYFRESRFKNFPGEHAWSPRKLVHIRRSTHAFGTSTRGSSKILNLGPSDITLRHCFIVLSERIESQRCSTAKSLTITVGLYYEYETVNQNCALPVQTCKHDVIKHININCFSHTL